MRFDDPEVVEGLCTQMRQADWPRSRNRALINNLMNGLPPYSAQEEEENDINFNINFLAGPRLAHDARTQFYQGILGPNNYFTSSCDAGPSHKRLEWGTSLRLAGETTSAGVLTLPKSPTFSCRATRC
jgi:hypothetical protein